MKWLKAILGVLCLASAMFVIGCADNTATDLESTGDEPAPTAGHEAAQQQMNKKT